MGTAGEDKILPINRISSIKDCSIGSGLKASEKKSASLSLNCTYHAGVRNRKRSHVTSRIPSCCSTAVALRGGGPAAGWPMACDTCFFSSHWVSRASAVPRLVETISPSWNDGQARCPPPQSSFSIHPIVAPEADHSQLCDTIICRGGQGTSFQVPMSTLRLSPASGAWCRWWDADDDGLDQKNVGLGVDVPSMVAGRARDLDLQWMCFSLVVSHEAGRRPSLVWN